MPKAVLTPCPSTRPVVYPVHPERVKEQHGYLPPEHVEYFVLGMTDRVEKLFTLVARLTPEAENLHRTESRHYLEARSTTFESAKEARDFVQAYYKGTSVERDDDLVRFI